MSNDAEIRRLSLIDAQAQCPTLRLSVVEEIGEIAQAIKVEDGGYGCSYKTLDEPSIMECVDLYICAKGMEAVDGPRDHSKTQWDLILLRLARLAERGDWETLANEARVLYMDRGGNPDDFDQYVADKLAKWAANAGHA